MEDIVRRFLYLGLFAFLVIAPAAISQQAVPDIPYDSVENFFKLPADLHFGEVSGVAVNSKGHVFVFNRGNTTGPAFGAAAAQMLEFGPDGKYIREIGKNLYAWAYAHTVRVDREDNIWAVDKGSDMVIKFNPEGRVSMVFGRKKEASDEAVPWTRVTPPRPPVDGQFRQPTDVTWDRQGNIFISDGYINSRVAKFDKNGDWVKSFGEPGTQPGQFDTPHSIASDANDNIYVADRGNFRIQVFDKDGKFLRAMKLDVPVPRDARPWMGTGPDRRNCRQSARRSALGGLHYSGTEPVSLRRGCISGTNLQADSRWENSWRTWKSREAAKAVRMDS
jgi:DNA-binding beta-propeller fold protein YncE